MAQQISKTAGCLLVFIAMAAFGAIAKAFEGDPNKDLADIRAKQLASMTPAQRVTEDSLDRIRTQEKQLHDNMETLMWNAVADLPNHMRDPDSFKMINQFVSPNNTGACLTYRAKNGFGGYTEGAAVATPAGTIISGQDEALFTRVWNKVCVYHAPPSEKQLAAKEAARKAQAARIAKEQSAEPLKFGPFVHDASTTNIIYWSTKCRGLSHHADAPVYFADKEHAEAKGYIQDMCDTTS